MIRPLRQRHRIIVGTLGAVLPLAFVAGIVARKPVPMAATPPLELRDKANDFRSLVWTKTDLWPGQRILTSLRRDSAGSVAVELSIRDLVRPDVLVYWAAGKEPAGEGLPGNARLLGALSDGTPLRIPADVHAEVGRFVLYSLADHEVVAASGAVTIQRN